MKDTLITTPCAGATLKYFGVTGRPTLDLWDNRNIWDVALEEAGFSLESQIGELEDNETVLGARLDLALIAKMNPEIKGFIVGVKGHILVIDTSGKTVVDTDPRAHDHRTIVNVWSVV
jgi:hypothetical protein